MSAYGYLQGGGGEVKQRARQRTLKRLYNIVYPLQSISVAKFGNSLRSSKVHLRIHKPVFVGVCMFYVIPEKCSYVMSNSAIVDYTE